MGNLDFSANADQLKELAAYMASQINVPTIGIGGGYAPIGTINFFDATVAPQDWLACDGSVYNIADYPQLAEWYATQHGASNFYGGDGTTTFAVSDLQGEFLRGTGTNSHANQGSGANVGVHQDGTVIPHVWFNQVSNLIGPKKDMRINVVNADSESAHTKGTNHSSTLPLPTETNDDDLINYYTSRPTNTSFLICVKAVVAGEVYSTEERVVGTWIDGKKIYQKTISCGALPNATAKDINHNITNLEDIIYYSGYAIQPSDNTMIILPFVHHQTMSENVSIVVNKTIVRIRSGVNKSTYTKSYITLRYVKTTD